MLYILLLIWVPLMVVHVSLSSIKISSKYNTHIRNQWCPTDIKINKNKNRTSVIKPSKVLIEEGLTVALSIFNRVRSLQGVENSMHTFKTLKDFIVLFFLDGNICRLQCHSVQIGKINGFFF